MSLNKSQEPRVFSPEMESGDGRTTKTSVENALNSKDNPKLQGVPSLPERYKKTHSGKVRETYQHPDNSELLIMVATDRISTHDIIHYGLVPGKGEALTEMSKYWFNDFATHESTKDIPNQVAQGEVFPEDFPEEYKESTVIVKKLKALPIEAIVRGYLYGSALKGYDTETGKLETGELIGKGLQKCSNFPEALFTPSTKSDDGDTNVDFETMVQSLTQWLTKNGYDFINPQELAEKIKDYSLRMYTRANEVSQEKGMILGDTKFEFGLDADGKLTLIDEACTADSSRLWTSETVIEGQEPESHDKQPARDFIIEYWSTNPDENGKLFGEKGFIKYSVEIPKEVIEQCSMRYKNVSESFTQK